MSTSERIVLAETAGVAVLVLGLVAIASPDDVWLRNWGLHPAWFAIVVIAARYAIRGLLPMLGFTALGLIAMSLGFQQSLTGFVERVHSTPDLLALTTAVVVAWVAMAHESRHGRSVARLTDAAESQLQAEQSMRALHASLGYLRTRHDRLDVSLSLWRNLSGRLERGDATEAARALLELCEIRSGARVGMVQLLDGTKLTAVARRGHWPTNGPGNEDATVRAAIESRQVSPAGPGATEADSDLAVPVVDDDTGVVVGVVALRGVSPSAMRAADLRDLGVLGQWLAPALARQLRREFRRVVGDTWPVRRSNSEVTS